MTDRIEKLTAVVRTAAVLFLAGCAHAVPHVYPPPSPGPEISFHFKPDRVTSATPFLRYCDDKQKCVDLTGKDIIFIHKLEAEKGP